MRALTTPPGAKRPLPRPRRSPFPPSCPFGKRKARPPNRPAPKRRGRHDQPVTALPVLILILLLCSAPWVTIPVLLLGLFLGFRYRFSGPDLENDSLNGMISSVADTASDLGHKVMEELKHDWHSDEK